MKSLASSCSSRRGALIVRHRRHARRGVGDGGLGRARRPARINVSNVLMDYTMSILIPFRSLKDLIIIAIDVSLAPLHRCSSRLLHQESRRSYTLGIAEQAPRPPPMRLPHFRDHDQSMYILLSPLSRLDAMSQTPRGSSSTVPLDYR